jgi:Alcohol dehydrogenase GroES-like domain
MRATCLTKYGSIENFASVDLPTPEPKRGQIRVRVHASAVGPADFKVTTGQFKFLHGRKFPMILGYDFSGVVDAVGYGQTRWKIGDPVFGFLPYGPGNNQGAFAEFLVTPDNQVARKPASVSHEQAAASATAGVTALQGIRDQGKLPTVNAHVFDEDQIEGILARASQIAEFLANRCRKILGRALAHLERLQIRAHDVCDAASFGGGPEFVHGSLLPPPRFPEGFDGHIKPDLVTELEAVGDGLCGTEDTDHCAAYLVFLDSEVKGLSGHTDKPDGRR